MGHLAGVEPIAYSEFLQLLERGKVSEITIPAAPLPAR